MKRSKTKPCLICGKKLKPMFDDWSTMQPNGGGEMKLLFAYGSRHDQTQISAVVCDECGEALIKHKQAAEK